MATQKTKFKQTEIGLIPEEWEEVIFSEVVEINPKRELKKGLIAKFVSMADVLPFQRKISNFVFREFKGGSKFKNGDTLFARITPCLENGKTAFVDILNENEVGFGSTEFIILSGKKDKTDNQFVYYLSRSPDIRSITIKSMTGTSGRQRVENDVFDTIVINLPPLPEQRAIAKILSDLDAKIELNQQMNKTLEEIGKAIFKEWFVNFNFPNEEGKPYKSSGGPMEYNHELGKEIPKGWRVKKLGEVGSFKNGVNYLRNEKGDTEFYIVNVRDISNNKFLYKESLDKICMDYIKAKEYLLHEKDIIIARSACPGEVSIVLSNLNDVIYSGFSIRYRVNNPENWLYIFLVLQELKKSLFLFSVGTTLTSVNQETLKNMNFIMPPQEILEKFNLIINSLFDKIKNNLYESLTLSQIRDLLLPKLMTGKIRVPVHKVNINSPAHEVQANSPAHEVQAGKEQL